MKNIAVIGSGIIGICTAFFLQKSGFKVTIFDKQSPGSMTSFGHACTFADYANVPINSPSVYKDIPKMLLRSDGPLAVDFSYVIKNLPWAFKFLKNCRREKVNEIAASLATVQKNNTEVEIGSYPFFRAGKVGVSIVMRTEEQSKIDICNSQILEFVNQKNIQIISEN